MDDGVPTPLGESKKGPRRPDMLERQTSLDERLGRGRRELRGSYRGTRPRVDPGTKVVVVGGGLAGIAAACVLAERGVRVTLLERAARLGGRMATRRGAEHLDPAFRIGPVPAIPKQYYNLRALIRRVDPELLTLRSLPDRPVLAGGVQQSFAGLPTIAPMNVLALVRRTPFLSVADLRKLSTERTRQLLLFDPQKHYAQHDETSAAVFLDQLGLPARAREVLFRVFTEAQYHDASRFSAAEMLASLHFHFLGNPEGVALDVLEESASDALFAPMERHLGALGVAVRTGDEALRVQRDRGDRVRIGTRRGEALEASGLVLAQDVEGLKALVAASPDLASDASFARSVAELAKSPGCVVWRLFLDVPLDERRPHYACVAEPGALDTISILDRFEGESRRYAMRTGGSVVQLQSFGVPDDRSDEDVRAELYASLRSLYPEVARAKIVHDEFARCAACPAFPPGGHALRPRVATPYGNITLAGDYVKLPFPSALMERAVASGILAANVLLDRWDVRGETVYTIPPRGFVSALIAR